MHVQICITLVCRRPSYLRSSYQCHFSSVTQQLKCLDACPACKSLSNINWNLQWKRSHQNKTIERLPNPHATALYVYCINNCRKWSHEMSTLKDLSVIGCVFSEHNWFMPQCCYLVDITCKWVKSYRTTCSLLTEKINIGHSVAESTLYSSLIDWMLSPLAGFLRWLVVDYPVDIHQPLTSWTQASA